MSNDKLFSYIVEGRAHAGIVAFKSWIDSSENYYRFVSENSDKIRRKFRGAKTDEDLIDVIYELELAFNMVCTDGYEVEYEKYGHKIGRSPDFTVTSRSGMKFNIEVKRIREGAIGVKYNNLIDDIVEQIHPIQSMLAFSVTVEDFDLNQDFVNRFEVARTAILNFIKDKIRLEDKRLSLDETVSYELPGFEDEISIILSKPKGKLDHNKTSYHGGSFPIFYTQKESNKFGDAIFEKVGQMVPGSINIIVIVSNSSTHEKEDFQDAILSIKELVRDRNESFFVKKGFRDINDFLSQAENLSGVLFKSSWSSLSNPGNYLWCNQNASLKIPDEIRPFLTGLGKSREI